MVRRPSRSSPHALIAACAAALAACGDDGATPAIDAAPPDTGIPLDAPVDAAIDAEVFVAPTMLSETGLYSDIASKTIAPGVVPFTPRWQLWSDDAVKRRWIRLPPGARIDTSDMDFWSFPQGTRVWKEFVRGGKRIETRLLWKIGPTDLRDDWFMVSFAWDAGETDATAVPDGVVDDAGHDDIPAQAACLACHRDVFVPSVVIGFSALQLDGTPAAGEPSVASLVADGRLTDPPAGSAPYFPLPAGAPLAAAAFGYMHANCGNCHNPRSLHHDAVPLELRLPVGALAAWTTTPSYLTTVDRPLGAGAPGATAIVEPGVPATSALYLRFTSTAMGFQMPKLGREVVDPAGEGTIRAWIASLPPTP